MLDPSGSPDEFVACHSCTMFFRILPNPTARRSCRLRLINLNPLSVANASLTNVHNKRHTMQQGLDYNWKERGKGLSLRATLYRPRAAD